MICEQAFSGFWFGCPSPDLLGQSVPSDWTRHLPRLRPAPRLRALPTDAGVCLVLGRLRLPIDDAACSPESLWAWLAAVDAGCVPAVLQVRHELAGQSTLVTWMAEFVSPLGICMRLHVEHNSPWLLTPPTSTQAAPAHEYPANSAQDFQGRDVPLGVEPVDSRNPVNRIAFYASADWMRGFRQSLVQACQAGANANTCRPIDLLNWSTSHTFQPISDADSDSASHPDGRLPPTQDQFWWHVSQNFVPSQLPRAMLDDQVVHHRLALRWAQHSVWAALNAWAVRANITLLNVRQITHGSAAGFGQTNPFSSAYPWQLEQLVTCFQRWQSQVQSSRPQADFQPEWARKQRSKALAQLVAWQRLIWHASNGQTRASHHQRWPACTTGFAIAFHIGQSVHHARYGAGRLRSIDPYQEPMQASVGFAAVGLQTVAATELTAHTRPLAPWADNVCMGSAATGLQGPFAGLAHSPHSRRHRSHTARRITHAEFGLGQALFIQAAPPPVKRLRSVLLVLAESFYRHAPTPAPADVDLAQPITLDTCAHDGTRLLLARLQDTFVQRFTEWQRLAVQSGRYFPPPLSLRLSMQADGTVCVVARFSPGYVINDADMAEQYPRVPKQLRQAKPGPAPAPAVATALPPAPPLPPVPPAPTAPAAPKPAAPPPLPQPLRDELPLEQAQQLTPAGFAMLLCGHVAGYAYYQGDKVIEHIHPGDPITLRLEPDNPHDALAVAIEWNLTKLGYVPRPLNQTVARLLGMGHAVQARIVATPPVVVPWRRVVFAVYLGTPGQPSHPSQISFEGHDHA